MRVYEVEYKGKTYRYQADDAMDAFDRFFNRKVFGRPIAKSSTLLALDKQTRGYQWALYAVMYTNAPIERVKVRLAV